MDTVPTQWFFFSPFHTVISALYVFYVENGVQAGLESWLWLQLLYLLIIFNILRLGLLM